MKIGELSIAIAECQIKTISYHYELRSRPSPMSQTFRNLLRGLSAICGGNVKKLGTVQKISDIMVYLFWQFAIQKPPMRNCLTWHWLCSKMVNMNQCKEIKSGKVVSLMGFFAAVALTVMAQPTLASQSVELTWSPSSSPDVVGYNIYYGGTATGGYNDEISVGNTTNATVSGLTSGTTYYFAAKAVNSSGIESTYSLQSSYVVPGAAAIFAGVVYSNNTASIALTGLPGTVYVIQASTNLVNWISLVTNVTPLQFKDTNAAQYKKRFYRAVNMF